MTRDDFDVVTDYGRLLDERGEFDAERLRGQGFGVRGLGLGVGGLGVRVRV